MAVFEILNKYEKKEANKISLEIRVLRTKKERRKECVYGPGKHSFGHKCNHCEKDDTICLAITEDIDGSGFSYITSSEEIIKSLGIICDSFLLIMQK